MIINLNNTKSVENVGNKAKFLMQMKKQGFNVPDGFVIDSNTYKKEIQINKIEDKINTYLNELNTENVSEISKQIISLFNSFNFSLSTKRSIKSKLKKNIKYAVRSSGTKEDLEEYSFAGQYQTFLNVESSDIYNKIIDCYKSMFSEVILNYFVNNNIEIKDLTMSVIVQEMIDSDYSGICFTVDPITGNDKTMLIEVGTGLGENIVSGQNKPEQYYYNWYDMKGNTNTNKYLNKDTLEKFGAEFFNIMLFFGYPCDIEFAIKDNELFILQSRRITKINYHDYNDIWTTADFKDGGVSASICTPYMWSLYEYIWEYTLRKFVLDSKILNEDDVDKKLGEMFFARCYWNLSVVKKAMSKVVGYKEREFDSEYGIKMDYKGDGQTTKLTVKSAKDIIKMAIAQKKILKTRNQNADKYKQTLLYRYNLYNNAYNTNKIKNIKRCWYRLTRTDYLRSESTYFWQIFINTIHQSLYKDSLLKYVSESEYLTLLGNIEDVSHMRPFYYMWNISRDIRKNSSYMEYWQNIDTKKIIKDIDSNKYASCIKTLIALYGYHSDKELDVTYKCYAEDPTPFINTIKDMILLDDEFGPYEDIKKNKLKSEEIYSRIKNENKKFNKISTKITNMKKMLWWREEFRDISTRFYYLIRIYTIKLAEEFVKENVLENIDDIWFLKVGNIWDFIDGKMSVNELKKVIDKNKKYYNAYRNYISENEIGCNISKINILENNNSIQGLGANSGIVIGTARIIKDLDEIDKLQPNDILITKFTDTGWTPKFAILSGIVTEYGGILCHAAIVSREYGIPAIVNCPDVMNKIKDGQKIQIDGASGIVTILEE